ncbi:hypothetical protein AVEN_241443-1 [Araneus ventricosus]|uniref:Uncharacterized protein n=1 Tax=Araneus ventricosus TaxID=182803 RepID=A0A4Y2FUH7_ARAVE|nr:hypothetical protein AVEN_241443-1 [Araneus ventricosus]
MEDRMEKGQEEFKKGQVELKAGLEKRMDQGQAEMKKGQEMKNQIQSHVESQDGKIKDHFNSYIEKIEEVVQSVKKEIGETQFDVVNSTNGWTDRVKASQLVASLRGSEAEVLQGIPDDKLMDLTTIENALEARFGDSHLTQFYRTELKTTRQKPG